MRYAIPLAALAGYAVGAYKFHRLPTFTHLVHQSELCQRGVRHFTRPGPLLVPVTTRASTAYKYESLRTRIEPLP